MTKKMPVSIFHDDGDNHYDEAWAGSLAKSPQDWKTYIYLWRALYIVSGLLIVSLVVGFYLSSSPRKVEDILVDENGRQTVFTPLDAPANPLPEIANWVTSAITQAFTLNFATYKTDLIASKKNFTDEGWVGFANAMGFSPHLGEAVMAPTLFEKLKALWDKFLNPNEIVSGGLSGKMKIIYDKKYRVSAVPTGAVMSPSQHVEYSDPGILDLLTGASRVNGRMVYEFQIPLLVTYEVVGTTISQKELITVTVVEQPESKNPRGLGIASIVAE